MSFLYKSYALDGIGLYGTWPWSFNTHGKPTHFGLPSKNVSKRLFLMARCNIFLSELLHWTSEFLLDRTYPCHAITFDNHSSLIRPGACRTMWATFGDWCGCGGPLAIRLVLNISFERKRQNYDKEKQTLQFALIVFTALHVPISIDHYLLIRILS